jgi:uncharacterized protein (DUF169 family)
MKPKELSGFFNKSIKQRGYIVAFKMFKAVPSDLLKYEEKGPICLCQAIKRTNIYGSKMLLTKETKQACWFGEFSLGFSEHEKTPLLCAILLGEGTVRKMKDDMIRLKYGLWNAILFAPLEFYDETSVEPDGVIFVVNGNQAMTLIWSFYLATLKKPTFSFNGHAACEIVAALLTDKSPWLTIPCLGARALAACQDDEVWTGFCYPHLKLVVESMTRSNIRFPMPLEQIVLFPPAPEHFITKIITP